MKKERMGRERSFIYLVATAAAAAVAVISK
jgi:homoaconitase/3-isopropylmalate dehydratase large subunit